MTFPFLFNFAFQLHLGANLSLGTRRCISADNEGNTLLSSITKVCTIAVGLNGLFNSPFFKNPLLQNTIQFLSTAGYFYLGLEIGHQTGYLHFDVFEGIRGALDRGITALVNILPVTMVVHALALLIFKTSVAPVAFLTLCVFGFLHNQGLLRQDWKVPFESFLSFLEDTSGLTSHYFMLLAEAVISLPFQAMDSWKALFEEPETSVIPSRLDRDVAQMIIRQPHHLFYSICRSHLFIDPTIPLEKKEDCFLSLFDEMQTDQPAGSSKTKYGALAEDLSPLTNALLDRYFLKNSLSKQRGHFLTFISRQPGWEANEELSHKDFAKRIFNKFFTELCERIESDNDPEFDNLKTIHKEMRASLSELDMLALDEKEVLLLGWLKYAAEGVENALRLKKEVSKQAQPFLSQAFSEEAWNLKAHGHKNWALWALSHPEGSEIGFTKDQLRILLEGIRGEKLPECEGYSYLHINRHLDVINELLPRLAPHQIKTVLFKMGLEATNPLGPKTFFTIGEIASELTLKTPGHLPQKVLIHLENFRVENTKKNEEKIVDSSPLAASILRMMGIEDTDLPSLLRIFGKASFLPKREIFSTKTYLDRPLLKFILHTISSRNFEITYNIASVLHYLDSKLDADLSAEIHDWAVQHPAIRSQFDTDEICSLWIRASLFSRENRKDVLLLYLIDLGVLDPHILTRRESNRHFDDMSEVDFEF